MKQLIHSLPDRDIMFIEVSKDSYIQKSDIPYGNWQLIGSLDSITEEQAAMVVEEKIVIENAFKKPRYMDYVNRPLYSFDTAIESLQSLIKSAGIDLVNPLGVKPDKEHFGMCYTLKQWESVQSKVWEKILILTRNLK